MPKFNFNTIARTEKADVNKIGENFTEIENNALANSDIIDNLTSTASNKVLSAKQGKLLNDNINSVQNIANAAQTTANAANTKANQAQANVSTKLSKYGDVMEGFLRTNDDLELRGGMTLYSDISGHGNIYIDNDYKIEVGVGTQFIRLNGANGNVTVGNILYVDEGYIRSRYTANATEVSNNPNMYITADGVIKKTNNTSSRRYKEDITELKDETLDPTKLYNLKVKQFKYKDEYQPKENDSRYNKPLIGFIAEEVAEVYPIAVDYEIDENGNKIVENWNERYIIPALLKLIQEQNERITALENKLKNT